MKNLFITAIVAVFAFTLPLSAKSSSHEEAEAEAIKALANLFSEVALVSTGIGLTYYGNGEYEYKTGRESSGGLEESGAGFFLSLGGNTELGLARFQEDTAGLAGFSRGSSNQITALYLSWVPHVNLGKGKIKKWGKHISLIGRLGAHLSETDLEIPGADPSSHTNYDFNWHYGYGAEIVFGSDPEDSPFRLRLERVIYNFDEWETDPYTRRNSERISTFAEHKRTYTGLSLIWAWGPWREF